MLKIDNFRRIKDAQTGVTVQVRPNDPLKSLTFQDIESILEHQNMTIPYVYSIKKDVSIKLSIIIEYITIKLHE